MEILVNTIKRVVIGMLRQMAHPRYGVVQSFNPNDHTARVLMQPTGQLSGWLPVATQWVGNGWGMFSPPSPGDQVTLIPQEGDADNYIVQGRVFALQGGVVPLAAQSGEFWLVHKSGAFIKLLNSGGIASNGTWTHTGAFTATGAITAGFGGADQVGLQTHTHNQPADSHGDTEAATNAPNPGT